MGKLAAVGILPANPVEVGGLQVVDLESLSRDTERRGSSGSRQCSRWSTAVSPHFLRGDGVALAGHLHLTLSLADVDNMDRVKLGGLEKDAEEALTEATRAFPEDHPAVLRAIWELAVAHADAGHVVMGADLLQTSLGGWRQVVDISGPRIADFEVLLATFRSRLGDHAEAALLLRSAIEKYRSDDPGRDEVRNELERLGNELEQLGLLKEAAEARTQVYDWYCRYVGQDVTKTVQAGVRAALTLRIEGDVEQARDRLLALLGPARETQDGKLVVDVKRCLIQMYIELDDWLNAAELGLEVIREARGVLEPNDRYGRTMRRWGHGVEPLLRGVVDGSSDRLSTRRAKRLLRRMTGSRKFWASVVTS